MELFTLTGLLLALVAIGRVAAICGEEVRAGWDLVPAVDEGDPLGDDTG